MKHSDDDLRKFVIEYCAGNIVTSNDKNMTPKLAVKVFLPLMFGADNNSDVTEGLKTCAIVYGHTKDALPRGIDGWPMLTECRFMNKEDWYRAHAAIVRELERRKEIEV